MNTIHPIGTKVQSASYDSPTIHGTVVGHAVVESSLMYIVKLDQGFFSTAKNTYVSLLVMHEDSVVSREEPTFAPLV